MLISPSLLSPSIIHSGLIPLSSETILIFYYFHFTGLMTSPYPHIISRGNFTPSRLCSLFPVSLSLRTHRPPFSLPPSISSHPSRSVSHLIEVTTQPLGSHLQRRPGKKSGLLLPSICLRVDRARHVCSSSVRLLFTQE